MATVADDKTKSKTEPRDPREKFLNYAQMVQGVCQVYDPRLTPTERLFLNCLAAYSVKTDPHPRNEKLMRACGVNSRQSVNKIAHRLLEKKLIEIVSHAKGGRGMAVTYRVRVQDARFPWPKKEKPATQEAPVSATKP